MIGRALLVALLAAPLAATAQTAADPGDVVFSGASGSDGYVSLLECSENRDLTVSWRMDLGTLTSFPTGGNYEIVAWTQSCKDKTDAGIKTVVSSFAASSDRMSRTTPLSTLLGLFGLTCQSDDTDLYVCVRFSGVAGVDLEDAEGILKVQVERPGVPTGVVADPADHALEVRWTAVPGPPAVSRYVIVATRVDAEAQVHREEVLAGTEGRVDGLDLTPYWVQVRAVSVAGNEGELSARDYQATPTSVLDFWERYSQRGRDDGGCATAGGTGLLAALAALALVRRRPGRRA